MASGYFLRRPIGQFEEDLRGAITAEKVHSSESANFVCQAIRKLAGVQAVVSDQVLIAFKK
jgi:hypothetical protein